MEGKEKGKGKRKEKKGKGKRREDTPTPQNEYRRKVKSLILMVLQQNIYFIVIPVSP